MPPIVACAEVDTSTGYHKLVRFELRVEPIQHDAGLHDRFLRLRVDREHLVEVLRVVDDQRGADGLAALRGAGAARQDRHLLFLRRSASATCAASSVRGTTTPIGSI